LETEDKNTLQEKPKRSKRTNKSTQSTILKQLNNQSLYPLRERIGIYVIASLASIGLILITYTGVMAFVTSATNGNGSATDVDVNIAEIHDMLDEIGDLIDVEDEEEPATQPLEDLHQYADELDDEDDEDLDNNYDESGDEDLDDEDTDEQLEDDGDDEGESDDDDDATPVSGSSSAFTTAVVSEDATTFFRYAGHEGLTMFFEGTVVEIVDWDYHPDFVQVRAETEFGILTGFISRDRLEPN